MNNKIILGLGAVAVIVVAIFVLKDSNGQGAVDHKNAEYVIDGREIQLTNGVSVLEIKTGAMLKITTRYFGNEVVKDLNGDGRKDVAFLLTQDSGGSGTFYYVVAALNTEKDTSARKGFFWAIALLRKLPNPEPGTRSS